ncbi:hypothetical protein CAMRE0001_2083 [Campylobacter rectus RM3267]|uniref:Uncharacterized protein n=1 Tax=Campylobacter rectus RM3267 TaxID=553218 RepID=B9D4M5_CAMRE|nr:hypothetical protein CAMRE0001_2083 [Campylobacter rectus RM3267]
MIFYFALLVTPKRRELRRKILAQIEHIVPSQNFTSSLKSAREIPHKNKAQISQS